MKLKWGLFNFVFDLCMNFWWIQIQRFTQGISEYPLHSNGLVHVPKALADIVESCIGAVFIDSDSSMDTVWTVFTFHSLVFLSSILGKIFLILLKNKMVNWSFPTQCRHLICTYTNKLWLDATRIYREGLNQDFYVVRIYVNIYIISLRK
jgi:hypothetical protein